jgi:hypothetical protein
LITTGNKKASQLTPEGFVEEGVTAAFHFAVIRKGHLAQSLSLFAVRIVTLLYFHLLAQASLAHD